MNSIAILGYIYIIMKQNVHKYVQYVIANNTHDNQPFKGGALTIFIKIYTYIIKNYFKTNLKIWLVSVDLGCLKSRIAVQTLNGLVVCINMLSNITH